MNMRSTSGNRRSRSVDPVGAQSTTHTSNFPPSATSPTARSETSSSRPGNTSSSSATNGSESSRSSTWSHSWISVHERSSSDRAATSWATTLSLTSTGSGPTSRPSASPRLWAESVESRKTRWPCAAAPSAVAAARLVLPTPPLPVCRSTRTVSPLHRPGRAGARNARPAKGLRAGHRPTAAARSGAEASANVVALPS